MWVSRNNSWNKDIKPLEKFLAERVIQRCDYEESISKKHRTVNGFIQLKELIKFCELSFEKHKTVKSLEVLINESKSKIIKQNIKNDFIIDKYFVDLKKYVEKLKLADLKLSDSKSINLGGIQKVLHDLRKFDIQLTKFYFISLKREILDIDYSETEHFHRNAKHISDLIDILIPFLLFSGYSISSLNEVLRKWLHKQYRVTAKRLLDFFSFQIKEFEFLIKINGKTNEFDDFTKILEKSVFNLEIKKQDDFDITFNRFFNTKRKDEFISYKFRCFDPNAHIREQYDTIIKLLVTHKERESLSMFNNHFDNCYWSDTNHRKQKYVKASLIGDPVSIQERKSTLRKSLIQYSQYNDDIDFNINSNFPVPENEQVQKSLYYYNLAIKSKSIENSFSLLWTSLETILPYRVHGSDIECIKHLVGRTLSLGSLSRDINSFADRIITLNKQNDNIIESSDTKTEDLLKNIKDVNSWFEWLIDDEFKAERFEVTKDCSELLAYEYHSIAKPLMSEGLDFLYDRINSSRESIEFQLQRIYLNRNRIVHAGYLVNEYTNLWLHLEWYIGQVLFFAIKELSIHKTTHSLEEIFRASEADYDYIMSYLDKNPKRKISNSKRIVDTILEYKWQAY